MPTHPSRRRLPGQAAVWLLAGALTATAGALPMQRHVLGVYSTAGGQTLIDNALRMNVEAVLQHLGLHLDYCEYEAGLPGPEAMAQYRGVVLWFGTNRLPRAAEYWDWLAAQLRAGRRVVLLNGTGPRVDAGTGAIVPLSRVNAALSLLGLRAGDNYTDLPLDIELLHHDAAMVEFERRLDHEISHFDELRSSGPANRSFLGLRMRSTQAVADAVVLTPNGGVASEGYVVYVDPATAKRAWRLDPFRFLAQALDVEETPRPDATTLYGNRIFFSHVDGDGIANRSYIDRRTPCGQVILEQVLQRYWMLPVTVSVIVAEVNPRLLGNGAIEALARRVLAQPNVEPASHTWSHPLVWNTQMVSAVQLGEYSKRITDLTASGQAVLPWVLPGYTYDPVMETAGSCEYITARLCPPDKPCRVLLWSGNCLPDAAAVAACADAGLDNLNGGDSRMDGDYPSYTAVAPLYRQVGQHIQVHSANANENLYTDLWTGPFGGFQNVVQTFERTAAPRQILPVNIYYHFYSGEHHASVLALRRAYDWVMARRQELFPIPASRYADVVRGLVSTQLEQRPDGSWTVRRNGGCRTIRFDACRRYPDLDRSQGVLGFRHHNGCLYVSLDAAAEHTIVLQDQPPARPYLIRATADVLAPAWPPGGGVRFHSAALDTATFVLANMGSHDAYHALVEVGDTTRTQRVRTRADGTLWLDLVLRGAARIAIQPAPDATGS